MTSSVELAQVWVPLMPEASRLSKGVEQIASDAEKRFGRGGKTMGAAMAKGVDDGATRAATSLKKVEAATLLVTKGRKAEADAAGRVRVAELKLDDVRSKSKSTAAQLAAAEETAARAKRAHVLVAGDLATKTATLSKAEKDHSTALVASQAGMRGAGSSASVLGAGMATAGRAAAALGAAAGAAAVAGIAVLAAGAVVAAKELYDLGSAWDDVSDGLRLSGATGDDLVRLNNAVKTIGTSVPETAAVLGNIVGDTSRFLHVSGTDLNTVSEAIGQLTHLSGEAVDVKDLSKVFRANAVGAEDMVPALDSLWRTSQTTGLTVNELSAMLVKSGPAMRGFGLNLGQQAALLASFEDAGIDATDMTPGLTKALATFAKDGREPGVALQETVTSIKAFADAGNDTAAMDLSNKIFGNRGGGKFFDAIKSGAVDIDTLTAAVDGTGDTIDQAATDTADWAERWQTFKNQASGALEPLGSATFDAVNGGLGQLADWTSAHQSEIILFFTQLGEGAVTASQFVLGGVADMAGGLGELIAPIGDVLGAVNKFQAWQADIRGDHDTADELRAQAEEFYGWGDGLTEFSRKAKEFIDSGGEKLKHTIHDVGTRAAEAAKLTTALGDTTAALDGDGVSITISDNSPEAIERLRALGVQVTETPTGLKVTATTDEGERILNAFREQQGGEPIDIPVGADTHQARTDINSFFKELTGQTPQRIPVTVAATTDNLLMPATRARGAINTYAAGKLPSEAVIQSPVGSQGLIQWAEPSTGGESFIPLGSGNRRRSTAIWRETGKRLGVMGFETGGIRGLENAASELEGTPYARGGHGPGGVDCSGAASWLVNASLGLPQTDRMATGNAAEWITQKGGQIGKGPAGTLRIGWKNGGPGGGHMAVTLPDGRNAEAGGSVGNFHVGGNVGADDGQFTNQAFIPLEAMYPQGVPKSVSAQYGPGGTGGGSGSGGGANGSSVSDAQDKVSDAEGDVAEKRAKLAEVEGKADAKESEKIAARNDLAKSERDADKARTGLDDAKNAPAGKDGSKGPDAKSFGGDMLSGAMEVLGIGDVFEDPTQWGIWKLATGLMNFGGGILKDWDPDATTLGGQTAVHKGTGRQPGPNGHDPTNRGGRTSDGGFGSNGLNGGDIGMSSAIGDTLTSVLPQVSDYLPNATTSGVYNDNSIKVEGTGMNKQETKSMMLSHVNGNRPNTAKTRGPKL
ncbi:hypothetical protein BH09ACT7_BH09ACT7_05070 [soil metagenome]